ncbi:exopolysaccharide biosynthesis polyprenyl glycosylphosphotransferase [Sphingomonas hengshuiensis]|nr:exopolysaccharide biosynthesis polyprenyl glycosylphosphotransferase [Sphingomonas hengshuiensis]
MSDVDFGDFSSNHGNGPDARDDAPSPALAMEARRAPLALRSKEHLRLWAAAGLIALDVIGLLGAGIAANLLAGTSLGDPGPSRYLFVFGLLVLIVSGARGTYSVNAVPDRRSAAGDVLVNILVASVLLPTTLFLVGDADRIPRTLFLTQILFSLALLGVARPQFALAARRLAGGSFTSQVLLLDGVEVTPERHTIAIHADYSHLKAHALDPVLLDRIGQALKNCDRVLLACRPMLRPQWVELLKGFDIDLEVLYPELKEIRPLQLGSYAGHPTLQIRCKALSLHDRILKRALDLVIAGSAVILLSPLLLVTAVAIKLDSPGPVLFRQPRIGRSNRLFEILKFRSMHTAQEDRSGAQSTQRVDRRVTRVGAIIRRLSIDELPQLFNVIRGEMSIAGPRPHAIGSTAEDLLFWEIEAAYFERHSVKPGMTGLAQIRGYRGATERRSDLSQRLQADLEYLSGWSIWRDVWIIARTAGVFVQKNAF